MTGVYDSLYGYSYKTTTSKMLKRGHTIGARCFTSVIPRLQTSSNTLYIDKLSFQATEEDIEKSFSLVGKIKEVSIVKDDVTGESKGRGMIVFESERDAKRASVEMQGLVIKNLPIMVGFNPGNRKIREIEPNNVLYIRNLPYDVTESDIMYHFGPYQAERCGLLRAPITKLSLGFGFIRFSSVSNATKALKKLRDTELKGRRVKLQYAKADPNNYRHIFT